MPLQLRTLATCKVFIRLEPRNKSRSISNFFFSDHQQLNQSDQNNLRYWFCGYFTSHWALVRGWLVPSLAYTVKGVSGFAYEEQSTCQPQRDSMVIGLFPHVSGTPEGGQFQVCLLQPHPDDSKAQVLSLNQVPRLSIPRVLSVFLLWPPGITAVPPISCGLESVQQTLSCVFLFFKTQISLFGKQKKRVNSHSFVHYINVPSS